MVSLRMLGLLMLMLLQCDADSRCPDDLLTLDPPQVTEKYGEVITVNCTSQDDDHERIYWTNGTTDFEVEDVESYVTLEMPLLEWNVKPQCKIMQNASVTCTKELEITIYKNPEWVDVYPIDYGKVVEGMEYRLQCDIPEVAPVQKLFVRWYNGNKMIKEDNFNNTAKTPVSESSILSVRISREDDGAQFRCEAQLDFGPHGPKLQTFSGTRTVSVHYAPVFTKEATEVYNVEENDNVTLDCEAEGNPPPHFHWTLNGENITEYTSSVFTTQVNTDAIYTCTAANDIGRKTKQIHVNVIKTMTNHMPMTTVTMHTPEAAPPNVCSLTLTPAALVVRFGDPASANCSTSDTEATGMGWEAPFGGTGFESPPTVTWTVEELKYWEIKPTCYITPRNDSQCEVSLAITLYKTPDNVSVSAITPGPMQEGKEHVLICHVMNVAPVQNLTVKWYRGNESVKTQMFDNTSVTPVNVSSTLRVTPKRDYNGIHFSCNAELHLGPEGPKPVPTVTSEPYAAVVHYKPLMKDCPTHYTSVEHSFRMDMFPCEADGNPPPTVRWYYQGKQISEYQTLTRDHSGKYTMEVLNELGRTNTSVDITIEYEPSFACNDHYEVKENDKFYISCEPEGIPTPTVTWYKKGKEVSLQPWTKHDSGYYLLIANNKHGTANHTLHLNVLYPPRFKEGNESRQVTPGANVTFDCSAEGNPAPEIQWKRSPEANVRETHGWRQKTISVTGATSTDAGVYTCVATNKVGNVTKLVTLAIKGETTGAVLPVFCWLILLIVLVAFVLLMVIVRRRSRKRGQYSFISDKPKEGSDSIPMTAKSDGVKA
ncbi:vascular cell adhesion protein 1 [Trachinotus anak]|uniref:vascular cell adhesion protein 1 n=1 Tax=Trachinotus anak TaxID=443729 RepID=UPI0039F23682